MRYSTSVPNFGEYGDVSVLVDLAQTAEAAGWDGFFLWDHIQFTRARALQFVDPWIAMTAIALQTERILTGPMVTPMPRRRPWKLARETVTLDRLSGGRLVFGVGIGEPAETEFEQFGEPGDARVRAEQLDEGLAVLTGLWSGERFSFSGSQYRVDGAHFQPPPLDRIPIWVAGRWPNKRPFRRAARYDGVFPIALNNDELSAADVRELVAYTLAHRSSDAPFDVVVAGSTRGMSAAEASSRVKEFASAGATWWIEDADPSAVSLDDLRRRLRDGPPRG